MKTNLSKLVLTLILALLLSVNCFAGTLERLVDRETAIKTILLEARGESLQGQIAVGEVIRNRAKAEDTSIIDVCLAPYQFSCWNDSRKAEITINGVTGYEYQRASMAWEASQESNLTKGATHYLNKSSLRNLPKWAKKGSETVNIGSHTFYRLNKA